MFRRALAESVPVWSDEAAGASAPLLAEDLSCVGRGLLGAASDLACPLFAEGGEEAGPSDGTEAVLSSPLVE